MPTASPSTGRGEEVSSTRCSARRDGSAPARSSRAAIRTRARTGRSARSAPAWAPPTSPRVWPLASSGRPCPTTIRVEFTGEKRQFVTGKDLILAVIDEIGVGGGTNAVLEFVGAGGGGAVDRRAPGRGQHGRRGRRGDRPVRRRRDDRGVPGRAWRGFVGCRAVGPRRRFAREVRVDLDALPPLIALPHLPGNVASSATWPGVKIDQVYVGNCANGTMTDLRQTASILRGRSVHRDCRMIVVPATQRIYREAARRGPARSVRRGGRDGIHADLRRVLRWRDGRARQPASGRSPPPTATSAAGWARGTPKCTWPTRTWPRPPPWPARSSIPRS